MTKHKEVCRWCDRVISDGEEPISHGMCQECVEGDAIGEGEYEQEHGGEDG